LRISHLKNEVLQVMDQLPEERQRQVLKFARSLASSAPVGVAGKDLLRFAGILNEQEARSLSQAIEKGCEQVDLNEW
jgi:hypothetical protein